MTSTESKPALTPEEMAKVNARNREPEVILATKVSGVVKWFSVKSGYGFINLTESNEDVFIHSRRIKYNNPKKLFRTLAELEPVEFDIIQGDKGKEAINVTGPDGGYVQGSQFAANKPKYYQRRSKQRRRKNAARKNESKSKENGGESSSEDTKENSSTSPTSTDNPRVESS